MGWFSKQKIHDSESRHHEFSYLQEHAYYFDSSCQTLRPESVIKAVEDYYHTYNACGGRVKYPWGKKVDTSIQNTREHFLRYFGKSSKDYAVAFTLNTTYGINLILSQLPWESFNTIMTTDIEHNSVFLPTITYSTLHKKERLVLAREHAQIPLEQLPTEKVVTILNITSNIDGRSPTLNNLLALEKHIHTSQGLVLYDAAQAGAHHPELIRKTSADAYFFSGHKMYGPSIGIILIKKSLLSSLQWSFIGGGAVADVDKESFTLLPESEDPVAPLEPGLQLWGEIIGMDSALTFLENIEKTQRMDIEAYEQKLAHSFWEMLKDIPSLHFTQEGPSTVISCWSDKMDAHTLAMILGEQGIMARSGYFCCHYYLKHVKEYTPLLRFSLGLHNTEQDIHHLAKVLTSTLSVL